MPPKNRRRNNKHNNPDPVECIPFKSWTFATFTSTNSAAPTVVTVLVNPSIDTRLAAIADNFTWYRFIKLKVTGYPMFFSSALSAEWCSMGYLPRTPDVAPATHGEIQAMSPSKFMSGPQTVPVMMPFSKSVLCGDTPIKWFQTIVGNPDTQFEVQGNIYFAGSGQNPTLWPLTIEGVCEFKGRTTAATNPLAVPIPLNLLTVKDSGKSWADRMIEADAYQEKSSNDSDSTVTIGGYVYKRL